MAWLQHTRHDTNHPHVLVRPNTTQSNPGNNAAVDWGTEVCDPGGHFSGTAFTAPQTGHYLMSYLLCLTGGVDSSMSYFGITMITSNRNYRWIFDPECYDHDGSYYSWNFAITADMDAADTAYCSWFYSGGSQISDIEPESAWSIDLLG